MIIYLIKSTICLALLLVFYHLVLEREKMHQFNRWYLLGITFFSLIVPFFIYYVEVQQELLQVISLPAEGTLAQVIGTPVIQEPTSYLSYIIGAYVFVSAILLFRFGRNLISIIQIIRTNERHDLQNSTLVLVDDDISPHSFGNYIFVNRSDYHIGDIATEIFTHELAHVNQRHTMDVLLIEILQAIFWINPVYYFLKKSIQLNHEFLADNHVLASHNNITKYQHLLLYKTAWDNRYALASNLSYSLTKKRLTMMTESSTPAILLIKKILVLPLFIFAMFLFGERVEAQKTVSESTVYAEAQKTVGEPIGKVETTEKQKESKRIRLTDYTGDSSITIDNVKYHFSKKHKKYISEAGVIGHFDVVTEYKKMFTTIKKMVAEGHYVYKSQEERRLMDRMDSDLGGMYARMKSTERLQVKRPQPFKTPYIGFVNVSGEVYFKHRDKLTAEEKAALPPPPPPLPRSPNKN